jgi:hypothetical protein
VAECETHEDPVDPLRVAHAQDFPERLLDHCLRELVRVSRSTGDNAGDDEGTP